MSALDQLGGLAALGSHKVDNMYHAGWAWAGSTPFRSTKLVAAHFGGTRNPLVISWPKRINPDPALRAQFHHVVDIAPTIYDLLGIKPPKVVNGEKQIKIDGTSLAYTFTNATAPAPKRKVFFDNNGSRALYKDGWMASTFGPLKPWDPVGSAQALPKWDSATDRWELHKLDEDFSQANDLAAARPEKLAELKAEFLEVAKDNKAFPIGAAMWTRLHPEDVVKTAYTSWTFNANTRRMPEFTAPGIGRASNRVEIDVEVKDGASGVLYALGGSSGGVTLYMDNGHLVYLYNMMIIEQYSAKSAAPIAAGRHKIEVITDIAGPGKAGTATLLLDGKEVGKADLKRTVPLAFTASETFDVGIDLGAPVAMEYSARRPFAFDGKIRTVKVEMKGN
jgi:arylsulfatase